jgi:hypothetical protein
MNASRRRLLGTIPAVLIPAVFLMSGCNQTTADGGAARPVSAAPTPELARMVGTWTRPPVELTAMRDRMQGTHTLIIRPDGTGEVHRFDRGKLNLPTTRMEGDQLGSGLN